MHNMKRYKNWVRAAMLLLLTMLTTTTVWAADDEYKFVLWFNDGTQKIVDFSDMPVMTYADGVITLKTSGENLTWSLTELKKLTFKDETTQTVVVKKDDGEAIAVKVEVEVSEEEGEKVATITSAEAAESEESTAEVAIPSEVTIDGETYKVTEIAENTFVGKTEVSDIYLPPTDEPLTLGKDALKISDTQVATVHSPISLLAQYSLNDELKQHVGEGKLKATVKAPNKYWTFSCGVDVVIPNEIMVYKCVIEDGSKVKITLIDESLLMVNNKRTILANNGVLVACPDDDNVNAYDIVANPSEGAVIAADKDAKSYGENWLEPVIKSKNYPADEYYVLKDNEFHSILDNNSEVPVGKAVLKKPAGVAATRSLTIVGGGEGTTGIRNFAPALSEGEGVWHNLNGQRIERPTARGIYVKNGKKVVIK
jgi:hypothetical protein